MRDRVFIDSNIFLYAFSTKDISKQKIAAKIVLKSACISTQVINEVSSNLIKKFKMDNDDIQAFVVDSYKRYVVNTFSKNVFLGGALLRDKYHLSYYDSLIVASALDAGCGVLYSEDMQHGQIIDEELVIVNPFEGVAK